VLVFGVLMFLAGSMLCGLAGEFGALPLVGDGMNQLIACRALQGLGAGALTTGAFAVVADIAPPAERGKYTGYFGAMFGFAGLLGPVLGGFLTDHATTSVMGHMVSGWRFIFYVNLPLGLVALYILLTKLPTGRRGADARIDWAGSALIVAAAVPLLLALTWGGQGNSLGSTIGGTSSWAAPRVLGGFALAATAFAAFIAVSRGKSWAVVPLDLFDDAVVARANIALFLINLGYIGVPIFLPLYLQVVKGISASQSGFAMLPLLFGILLGSTVAGRTARKTKAYKPVLVIGGVVALLAVAGLTQLTPAVPRWLLSLTLFGFGLGLGPAQGMFTLAIQSAVGHERVGVATASAQFCRQMGATIGVAMFGALLTHHLSAELGNRVPELASSGSVGASSGSVGAPSGAAVSLSRAQTLAMDGSALRDALAAQGHDDPAVAARVESQLQASFAQSIEALFPVSLLLMLAAFGFTLAIPARELRGRPEPAPDPGEAATA
jgi:MFS family permease